VPDPTAVRELVERHKRRLYTFLQALLPGVNPAKAYKEVVSRIERLPSPPTAEEFVSRADDLARQVAAEHRKTQEALPFSDDLFRQLADSAGPILDQYDRRPAALAEVLRQLPPPERRLLTERYSAGRTIEQIAALDGSPVPEVARDLFGLHASLVAALHAALPDAGPPLPGGAADLGRLSVQLVDGTITDDGRLVLETLLLGDVAAQAHYHRNAALVAGLDWEYGWHPTLPEPPAEPPTGPTAREWVVTVAFVVAVLTVVGFAVLRLAGYP
jgi:DNA-directed RNA polymerase specialized sigma24 family protein